MNSRGLQVLLVCSLVLNVFAIGAMAGAAVMWKRADVERPLQGAGQPARLRQAAADLSPGHRREMRRAVVETARELRPQMLAARAARVEARGLLAGPEFDAAAFRMALERARNADFSVRSRIESRLAELAADLPQQERAKLAQALERPRAARRRGQDNPAAQAQP